MKTVVEQKPLFETLSAEESANVNGACHYWNHCANPCYSSGWGGGGWGGGSWGGSSSAVTQTTNVNVLIND